MLEAISRWSLRKLFLQILEGGDHTELFARLHHFLSSDSSAFLTELEKVVQATSWSQAQVLLERLSQSKVGDWVPQSLWPRFFFLDIEYCPYRKIVKEIAVHQGQGLHTEISVDSKSDPKGLSTQVLQDFLDQNLPSELGFLVGHNIRRFDVVRLQEAGVRIPDLLILDTLELSLLAHPLRLKHSLDGSHRAEDDVRSNLELLISLDQFWLQAPQGFVLALSRRLGDPGLKAYFTWLVARRGWEDALLASPRASRPGHGVQAKAIDPGLVRRAPTHSDILGEKILAQSGVLADRWTLRHLRRRLQEKSGSLAEKRICLHSDQVLKVEAVQKIIARPQWSWVDAFLLAWWNAGGEHAHEMHPFVFLENSLELKNGSIFKSAEHREFDIWEHRLLWECGSLAVRVVVHPELLYDADVGQLEVNLVDEEHKAVVRRLFQHREFRARRDTVGPARILFDLTDRKDGDWLELSTRLRASSDPTVRSFGECLVKNDRVILRYHESSDQDFAVQAWPVGEQPKLPQSLKSAEAWIATDAESPFLKGYLKELDVTLSPEAQSPMEVRGTLKVAAHAGLGSPYGVRRDIVSLLPFLLTSPSTTGLLGFGEAPRLALAFALNSSGVVAHHQNRYGNRSRTVQRTADQPGIFLADSRTAPMPAYTRQVVLSRLPFPSRDDPAIVINARGQTESDVFSEIVMPVMLERLRRQRLGLLQEKVDSVLFDRRALDFGFRDQIEAAFGEVQEVQLPESDPRGKMLVEKLQAALPSSDLVDDADPVVVLRRLQGPDAGWRDNQELIVSRILKGENLLAVLPTGSGKSLCFQIPALLYGEVLETLTLIISPLRALMRDQVQGMRAKGIFGVDCYHGELSSAEKERVLRDIRFGWTVMLYLAPEQLLSPVMVDTLQERGVRLIVVDEAHCLSEWGHDFRPEYLKIPALAQQIADARAEKPAQIIAFTATATKPVQAELIRLLNLSPVPVIASVARKNLHPVIEVLAVDDAEPRLARLETFIRSHPGQDGLVYAFRRRDTEFVCQALRQRLADIMPLNAIDYLHAGAPDRARREREYLDPERPTKILVATTAFGMGIDKPDIGWIAHFNAPQTVEDYAQQMGRAARDPNRTASILTLVHAHDIFRQKTPLEDSDLGLALDYLRKHTSDTDRVNVDVEEMGRAIGLKEEEAKAALFLLERSGALVVEQWSAQFQTAKRTANDVPDLGSEELLLLAASPAQGVPDLATLRARFPKISESEWVRRQRQLIRKGALAAVRQLTVSLTAQDAVRRLGLWEERELVLAQWLNTEFSKQMGRPLRLSLTRLLDVLGPGVNLLRLERILTCWRISRLIFQEQGLTDVRLSRNRHHDLLESLQAEREDRASLLRTVETTWPEPRAIAKGSREWERWRETIAGLEARGAITVEDSQSAAPCFRVRLLGSRQDDASKLASIDYTPRKRSARERSQAVTELFSKSRISPEIWSFLRDYFERSESPELAALRQKLLQGLTAQQAEAVSATGREPLLINAGAGTGKTHVLSRRLMMLQGLEMVDGQKLLVLSFSRAGASAIGARSRFLGSSTGLSPIRCLTFHSFARQILQIFSYKKTLVGRCRLTQELQRENDWRRNQLFNRVMVDHYAEILADCQPLKTPSDTIDAYLGTFDALRGGHPQLDDVVTSSADFQRLSVPDRLRLPDDRGDLSSADVGKAFARYLSLLERTEQTDFSGMVTDCLVLLRTNGVVRRRLQRGIRHLLVDEFQDTSRAQEAIMRALAEHHGGLTVVGDSDQTIYTFNGSDVRNILDFAKRNKTLWPDRTTRVTNLEENFRSTPNIIDTSTRFIVTNKQRVPKQLRASDHVDDEARQSYRKRNLPILLRQTPTLAAAVACAFSTVRDWIDEGFFPNEIAVLSRLNPASNPEKRVLEQLREAFQSVGVPVAAEAVDNRQVADLVVRLAGQHSELPLTDLSLDHPALAALPEQGRAALLEEARNLGLSNLGEWAVLLEQERGNPSAVSLQDPQGVQLLTIHQSKGREFRRVIVLHLADKFFPPALSAFKNLEEERRVLYVALTRAEELLMVTGESDNILFSELIAAAGQRAEFAEWEGHLPQRAGEAYGVEDEAEPDEPSEAQDTAEPSDEEADAEPETVEVRIEETNLLSRFQAWMEDDDEDD